jgi:hypothetical protein
VLLAYITFYDQRSGGVEIEIKEDKQGLGTSKRNKKRFAAQQILCQLEVLAHNLLVWARPWLMPYYPRVAKLGMLRLVRDVFHMNGAIGQATPDWADGPAEPRACRRLFGRNLGR